MKIKATVADLGYGAGQIDPVSALHPGLIYDLSKFDYIRFLCEEGYSGTTLRLFTKDNTNCASVPDIGGHDSLNYPSMYYQFQKNPNTSITLSFIGQLQMWDLKIPSTRQLSRRWGISRSLLFRTYWLLVSLMRKILSTLRYRGYHCCSKLTKLAIYQHHWNGVTLNIESRIPYSLLWHNRCRWHFLGLMSNNAAVLHPPQPPPPPPPKKNHLLFVI